MKRTIIMAAIVFGFASCNNPNSSGSATDSTSVDSNTMTPGPTMGGEGTDTGKGSIPVPSDSKSGATSEDTTLRNGSMGLNNAMNQSDSNSKKKRQ